ncbi:PIN domain nuclease [Microbacterium sp.]|uniref:PIN domain nuclease n=1 Tax=Microbacterium sp. TaxID=51671 RepID=UPI0039E71C09
MAVTRWLLDKSAFVRMQQGHVADMDAWNRRIERGVVQLSAITRLELGFSARSAVAAREAFDLPPLSLMPIVHATPAIEDRAFEVQLALAARGQHRAPSIPDLMIAATAEKCGLTVLAVDKDFDLIAAITGQPMQRLES